MLRFNNITSSITSLTSTVNSHTSNTNNPHGVTKSQVGLGNVDNTSDLNKPISTAQQSALDTITLDLSSLSTSLTTHTSDEANPHNVTKTQVGLGNVDNTSDLNKPVSTAQQTAIDTAVGNIKYKTLTQQDYEGITTPDSNTLYFITDLDN